MTADAGWKLEARWHELPLVRPLLTARGALSTREGWLVRWSLPGEPDGVGEVAPLPDFGTEEHTAARSALEALLNRDLDPGRMLDAIPDSMRALRCGLHAAWTEVLACQAGVPLWCMLEGAGPERAQDVHPVRSQGLVGGRDGVATCLERIHEGFDTLKLKVGLLDIDQEVARLEAIVRGLHATGALPRLRLDANGAWSGVQARSILPRLARLGFEWIEEPVDRTAGDDMAEMASLGVPLALDERLFDLGAAREAIRDPAVTALVLKPVVLGGLDRARELALEALDHGKSVVIGSSFEGPVGHGHLVHLAASLGRPDLVHGLGTRSWFLEQGATPVDHARIMPPAPAVWTDPDGTVSR